MNPCWTQTQEAHFRSFLLFFLSRSLRPFKWNQMWISCFLHLRHTSYQVKITSHLKHCLVCFPVVEKNKNLTVYPFFQRTVNRIKMSKSTKSTHLSPVHHHQHSHRNRLPRLQEFACPTIFSQLYQVQALLPPFWICNVTFSLLTAKFKHSLTFYYFKLLIFSSPLQFYIKKINKIAAIPFRLHVSIHF